MLKLETIITPLALNQLNLVLSRWCGVSIGNRKLLTWVPLQVADFGMARQLESGSRINTFSCGTITHSAPELMDEGRLSPAVVRPLPTHPGVPCYPPLIAILPQSSWTRAACLMMP